MVLVFIFCQCFTIVADIYELTCTLFPPPTDRNSTFCKSNVHIENFIDIAHFMIAVNSSVNFIFYMLNIKEFRESFVKVRNYFHVTKLIKYYSTSVLRNKYLFCFLDCLLLFLQTPRVEYRTSNEQKRQFGPHCHGDG